VEDDGDQPCVEDDGDQIATAASLPSPTRASLPSPTRARFPSQATSLLAVKKSLIA
jgi:hypothetical protein